jgi:flagellin FlaB
MLGNDQEETNRGQVGIGTLIVFIAMVLVAAIAAGVLINTAGFLQTQAEDTGTSSTEQVADNLNVITAVGEVGDFGGSTANATEQIRLGVQPAAGSNDINLAKLTLQYVSDDEFANLVVGIDNTENTTGNEVYPDDRATGDTDPDNIRIGSTQDVAEYGIDVVTAENEDDVVMTDSADRYELLIPLEANDTAFDSVETASQISSSLNRLNEGETAEVTITTEVGAQTVAFLQVPDSLSAESTGDTVNL